MAEHKAIIRWQRSGPDFLKGKYSREHTWTFDGGVTVPASPAPSSVPAPYSNPAHVDPEEAFVASISSCHMLWYLHLCSEAGIVVTDYSDNAKGTMIVTDDGGGYFTEVTLYPEVTNTERSMETKANELHKRANQLCFVANSCNFPIHHRSTCKIKTG